MGIGSAIARQCKQIAVYWGDPVNDGEGGFVFDPPVEILCRWEDKNEVFISPNGEDAVAKSIVYVLQDLDLNGFLYLGTLDTLYDAAESSGAILDPKDYSGAFIIRRVDNLPSLNPSDGFLKKVYLTSKNMV
jgi:hypothetical protein